MKPLFNMYPFATDAQEFFFNSNPNEVQKYLHRKIESKKRYGRTICDGFYGKVKANSAIFELCNFPFYNAFRPLVLLSWVAAEDGGTHLRAIFSLNKYVYLVLLILPIMGLYISLEIKMIIPFAITTLLYLILIFGVVQVVYRASCRNTRIKLHKLLENIDM